VWWLLVSGGVVSWVGGWVLYSVVLLCDMRAWWRICVLLCWVSV
jgi:hypothetical protein